MQIWYQRLQHPGLGHCVRHCTHFLPGEAFEFQLLFIQMHAFSCISAFMLFAQHACVHPLRRIPLWHQSKRKGSMCMTSGSPALDRYAMVGAIAQSCFITVLLLRPLGPVAVDLRKGFCLIKTVCLCRFQPVGPLSCPRQGQGGIGSGGQAVAVLQP